MESLMTAEIAVFNKSGIALAADSAVTATIGFSEKIYNNADKLFELSRGNPVALMIYNNAAICDAPWELLIKAYRKNLNAASHPTISDYASSFFDFIKNNSSIITSDMQKKFFFSLYSDAILPEIMQQVQNEDVTSHLQTSGSFPSTAQYHGFIEKRVIDKCHEMSSNPFFMDFDASDFALAQSEISLIITQICALRIPPDELNLSTPYPQTLINALVELFANYTCKESNLQTYSGIVFAGYGDDEYYPVVESHHVYGVFNNKIMRPVSKHRTNNGHTIGIYPFAQDDEVHTFMQGCSQGIINCLHESIDNSFNALKSEVTNIISSNNAGISRMDIEAAFDACIPNHINSSTSALQSHMTINHVHKVLSMLGSLAKVDLGYMAESLVNLTAFKRKVSNESDSVGGPIDVAVLSKGDGFVWLKRKHYFDKELNYQYFNRQ